MRIRSTLLFTISHLFILFFSNSVFAQQNPLVQFGGTHMRAALDLPNGISTVTLCGLEPGNSYTVIVSGAVYGQRAEFELAPASISSKGAGGFAFMREGKDQLRFAAPTVCVDLQVNTLNKEQSESAPVYLSIQCESCTESNKVVKKIAVQADQAVLGVQGGISAEDLIRNVLVGGGCFQISNVTYSGQPEQIGTFSNGLSNIGFSNGLIMATGNIAMAPGPNNSNGSSQGYGIATPDAELQTLTSGNTFDKAVIEFDFVPTQNQVAFEYAFASEEYCEYANSQYNDVFGFFISGPGITGTKNIALLPNSNKPVTINTINHINNSNLYVHNTPFFGDNCGILPAFGLAVQELEYDGFTKKLVAIADVIPCEKYHIKLKIADVKDGVWDSAVFLRANSFNAGGEVLASADYPGGFNTAYENCNTGHVRFKRGNTDLSQPVVVNFTVGGTATPGVDYTPILSPIIIPAGQTEVLLPIQVIPDLIPEGSESIQLTIPNACSCTQSILEFLIQDHPTIDLQVQDQTICTGETATLAPVVAGGMSNYSYQWSSGETTAFIHPTASGTYSLTVVDGCGASATIATALTIQPLPTIAKTILLCHGETVTLNGLTYAQPGVVVLNLPSGPGGCDTVATYTLQYAAPAPSNLSITCPQPITLDLHDGSHTAMVQYASPTVSSDCPCPGIGLRMSSGLASGSLFPAGSTTVCFEAWDSCGQKASCCFPITIQEDAACDIRINGCMKYELLTITEDPGKNRTYRIRVTNNCSNKLIYTAIQQPDGLVAIEPYNAGTYTAPSGNTYKVRNPNFSPQYSIRYSSISDSINNGESDIFKYTLPAQADVTYISVVSRLEPYMYIGAHLNTYYCPIGITPTDNSRPQSGARSEASLITPLNSTALLLFPNPTSGELFADFSNWQGQKLNLQVLDSRGQRVQKLSITAGDDAQAIELSSDLPNGLYFLEVMTAGGERHPGRFVVQR